MYRPVIWILIVVAGIGCFVLNWTASNNATFNLSAADLAEWASLHPEVRGGSPALLASLLVRLPAAFIICIVVMQLRRDEFRRIILIGVGVIGAISLLPPWEFFTLYSGDPNYRQQAAIAALTLASCAVVSSLRRDRFAVIQTGLAMAAGISALAGVGMGLGLIRAFGIETSFGLGSITVIVASAATGIFLYSEQRQSARK